MSLIRSIDVSPAPVRACLFIARKNWIAVGGDDMQIRVFNYNTLEKVAQIEAHMDYIRTLCVHPTLPFLLSAGDDMHIKLWNWEENWRCVETFKGHTSYVMYLAINPKDPNTFASACMDRTVKVWSLNSPTPNFTLVAHESKGVNFVEYYPFADKPYLITTSDDKTIKIFDYQSKSCVATLTGHTHNVSFAVLHPELPIIISGSEDSTIKIWNAKSYQLEQTLNYGMERAWCVATRPNSNVVAIGYETGNMILRFGSDTPAVSMDVAGKLVWTKNLEAYSAVIKATTQPKDQQDNEEEFDGTWLTLSPKDLGTVEVQPSQLIHSPNGRFVAVVGDGEYIIYTALAWRNKSFGQAAELAWTQDSNEYAIRTSNGAIRSYRNFTERPASHFNVGFAATRIFGGTLLGIAGDDFVAFYDWESGAFVQRVDVEASQVVWSDSGELVAIVTADVCYILAFDRDRFTEALASDNMDSDEGIDGVLQVLEETNTRIHTAKWVGDCLIFTTAGNRLNYLVGNQVYNISHFDKEVFLLGYLPRENAIYLCDKDVRVVSHRLSLALIEYQTVVLRGDMVEAAKIFDRVPQSERNRLAQFLEAEGHLSLALEVSRDPDHRFDLALALGQFEIARDIAEAQDSNAKLRALGDQLLKVWRVGEAERCFERSGDLNTLLLIYTSTGEKDKAAKLAQKATELGQYNLAFNALWYVGDVEGAADLLNKGKRCAEAALLSLTWGGNVAGNVRKWKASLVDARREKIADSICSPETEPDRFPANVGEKSYVRSQTEVDLIGDDEIEMVVEENAFETSRASENTKEIVNVVVEEALEEPPAATSVAIGTPVEDKITSDSDTDNAVIQTESPENSIASD